MTLAEWNAHAADLGVRGAIPFVPTNAHTGAISGPPTGAYVLPDATAIEPIRWGLWPLDDYLVSSVRGGSIWLVPR